MRAEAENGETRDLAERPHEVSAAVRHLDLSVGGMTCPRCPPLVEKTLKQVDGVRDADVNLATGLASIDYNPARVDTHDLIEAVRGAGYSAGTATARIGIKGINCGSCVRQIEQALMATPGVVSAGVNLTQSVADVAYQPQIVDFEGVKRAILEAGYGVAEPRGAGPEAGAEEEAEREREYRTGLGSRAAGGEVARTFEIGGLLHGIDLANDGATLFVSAREADQVVGIDLRSEVMERRSLGPQPYHLTAEGDRIYVTSAEAPKLWVLDAGSLEVVREIPLQDIGHQVVVSSR